MKILVLGAPCSGKTSLVDSLRESQRLSAPILEMDEELRKLNGGDWPEDNGHKSSPQIYDKIAEMDRVIFFTSYIPEERLIVMIKHGFKIIQLHCSLDVSLKRNMERMRNDTTLDDEGPGIRDNTAWQGKIFDRGIVDYTVDTSDSLEDAEKKIAAILEENKV